MDLSALESISKALEESLDFWGLMLLLATALVVIGLVVEYWHDVQEFWMRLTWPMASFPWDKFSALAGGILVTIGVAGELLVTYKASRVETQLRENSHKIEALLTQEAGDAATSAKTAHDEADAAKLASGKAQDKADAVAKQAGDLLRKYVDAEQNIEAEKKKRLQLAASLLDRNFRDQSGAIEELSSLAPVSVIFRFPQEREIRKMAEQINFVVGQLHWQSSLQPPGWYVKPGITITPGRPQFSGSGSNWSRVNEWQRIQAVCEAVAKALQHSGLDATAPGPIPENLPPNTIVITVGETPNHVLDDAIKELGEPAPPTPTGRFHAKFSGGRVEFPDSNVAPCATPCKTP